MFLEMKFFERDVIARIRILLDVQHKKKGLCEDRPASSFVVSLGKAFNGIAFIFEWLE